MTHFIVIFALLLCSGTDPTGSLRYACITNYFSILLLIDITPISDFAVMSNAAVTMLVHTFWYACATVSLKYTLISGVAESQGRHTFKFIRLCQTVFQSGYISLFACQQYVGVFVTLHFANPVLSDLKCFSIHRYKTVLYCG